MLKVKRFYVDVKKDKVIQEVKHALDQGLTLTQMQYLNAIDRKMLSFELAKDGYADTTLSYLCDDIYQQVGRYALSGKQLFKKAK